MIGLMEFNDVIVCLFAGITILSAGIVAFSRNIVHAAFAFLAAALGISGLFMFLGADFVAVAVIFIYSGIVLLLVLFIIFLAPRFSGGAFSSSTVRLILGSIVSIALLGLLIFIGLNTFWIKPSDLYNAPALEQLGLSVIDGYALPLEIGSLVLLAAMTGGIMIARRQT